MAVGNTGAGQKKGGVGSLDSPILADAPIQSENNVGHAAVCAACPLRVRHVMYHLDELFIPEKPLFEDETGTGGKVLLGTVVVPGKAVPMGYILEVTVPVPVFAVGSGQYCAVKRGASNPASYH